MVTVMKHLVLLSWQCRQCADRAVSPLSMHLDQGMVMTHGMVVKTAASLHPNASRTGGRRHVYPWLLAACVSADGAFPY